MLFITGIRFLNKSFRKIISTPVKGSQRLMTIPLNIYIRRHFPKDNKHPQRLLTKLSKRFAQLSKPKKAKYVKIAKSNLKIIKERRAIFKDASMTGYKLFTKMNFKKFNRKAAGAGNAKIVNVMKAMAEKWKVSRASTKALFNKKAAKIKETAIAQRAKMIHAYSKLTVP